MFGDVVRAHRRRLGLSQEELAERTGVGVRSIGKIENGRIAGPRPATVRLLADAFGLTGPERDRFCEAGASPPPVGSAGRAGSPDPAGPAQLPADRPGFVGRAGALAGLDAVLHLAPRPGTVVVAGSVGVGKSTLAVHWAHSIRDRFGDGQLFADLRGFDPDGPALEPATVLRGFLEALGVSPYRLPRDIEALAARYRSLLADRNLLVVLDNARDADQVRPLLPGSPGCLALVTSRNSLAGLVATDSAHPIALDVLSPGEARLLLAGRLGAGRVGAEPAAVDEIVAHAARLPLALAVVAARAAAHPGFPLETFAGELRDARARLDALTAGTDPATDVRAVFFASYRPLTPESARLFRLLGLHPGPDVTVAAAASLAGVPPREVRGLLAELAATHLISEPVPGRYAFHDLLRDYAREQADAVESADRRQAARQRVLDHYLHSATAAALRLNPVRDPIALAPPDPSVTPESPADHGTALAWFTAERPVLLAAIDAAARAGFDRHVWQLAWTLVHFLDRRGYRAEWAATQQAALDAARRLDDPTAQAVAHRFLALALIELGRLDEAQAELELALPFYRRTRDRRGEAQTQMHLGLARVREGNHARALTHARKALQLFETGDHRAGQALALNGIGWLQAQLGDDPAALAAASRALTLAREIGSTDEQAATLDTLGSIHQLRGRHQEALDCYRQALDLMVALGDRYGEAGTLTRLGEAQTALGDPAAGQSSWWDALEILEDLDHPDAEPLRARLAV